MRLIDDGHERGNRLSCCRLRGSIGCSYMLGFARGSQQASEILLNGSIFLDPETVRHRGEANNPLSSCPVGREYSQSLGLMLPTAATVAMVVMDARYSSRFDTRCPRHSVRISNCQAPPDVSEKPKE